MSVSVKERYSKRLKIKTCSYEIDFIDPSTKERIRETQSGFTTKKEAREAGRKRELELKDKTALGFKKTKVKFEKWTKDWLSSSKNHLAASTWERYKTITENVLIPELGEIYLDKITSSNIKCLYKNCIEKHNNSTTTVRQYHWILSNIFKSALREKIIEYNVMDTIVSPKKEKVELAVYNKDQLFILLDRVKNMTCYMPILLSGTTGLRLGEVCGLRWKNIDLDKKRLYVTRQLQNINGKIEMLELKTSSSKREVPLLDETITALKNLKNIQEYNKNKHTNYDKRGFVIAKEDGTPYDPDYISRNYRRVMKDYDFCNKLNLPYIRFHDLRHTYATMLLAANVNPKIVSELMGHSTVSMTLNTYSHVLPSLKDDALNKLENFISPKPKRKKYKIKKFIPRKV